MFSITKFKSFDFYRKIPKDLTEASLSGAGLSIIAAISMIFLFGMEVNNYLTPTTSESVIVDRTSDGELLILSFEISFPSLSCEFASVDVDDVLGTNRMNITKMISKFPINSNLVEIGGEFHPGLIPKINNHGDEIEDYGDDSISLTAETFDKLSKLHSILVVNFYAPWCYWSNRLKPSWERAAKIMRERYDPETDRRILMAKVDCTADAKLCKRHHIQGYPSIRIFHNGSDIRDNHGHHEHESYYGERDTQSLVTAMENLLAPVSKSYQVDDESKRAINFAGQTINFGKRPAQLSEGCKINGIVHINRVPGNLVISARSGSHSIDASQINVSHIVSHFSFSRRSLSKARSKLGQLIRYGDKDRERLIDRAYVINQPHNSANVSIEHYIQIIKLEVVWRGSGKEQLLKEHHQYTAHSSLIQSHEVPVAKFHLEPSPMQILITEIPKSFSHFITNICAVIGGIFTVAGILDRALHNTAQLVKKSKIGKHF